MDEFCRLLNFRKLIVPLIFLINSCGFISDDPIEKEIYKGANLATACEAKLNEITVDNFLNKNISKELNCLRLNLESFTKYVNVNDPDFIDSQTLIKFINTFFPDDASLLNKGVDLIFRINHLMFKDEQSKISKRSLALMFTLLVELNKEAIIIFDNLDLIQNENNTFGPNENYWIYRNNILNSIKSVARKTTALMGQASGQDTQLNLNKFLKDIIAKVETQDINNQTIDSLMFIKEILLSGDRNIITTQELSGLLGKVPVLAQFGFDLVFSVSDKFDTSDEYAGLMLDNVNSLYSIISKIENSVHLLNLNDVNHLLENLFSFESEADLELYKNLVNNIKLNLLSGGEEVNFLDLKYGLNTVILGLSVLENLLLIQSNEKVLRDNPTQELLNEVYSKNLILVQKVQNDINAIFESKELPLKYKLNIFLTRLIEETTWLDFLIPEHVQTILSFKTILFSKDDRNLIHDDFYKLANKIEEIYLVYFNSFYRFFNSDDSTKNNKMMLETSRILQGLLSKLDESTYLSTVEDALRLINIVDKEFDIDFFTKPITKVKNNIISINQTNTSDIFFRDILNIGKLIEDYFQTTFFNLISYESQNELMSTTGIINNFPFKDLPEYKSHFSLTSLQKEKDHFKMFTKKFRFFRDKEFLTYYYGREIVRNQSGFAELNTLNWLLEKLLKGYGTRQLISTQNSGFVLNKQQMENFFCDIKPAMEYFDYWPENFSSFSNNTVLLAGLFQSMSNGYETLDIDETTEYAGLIFSALSLGGKIFDNLKNYCDPLDESQNSELLYDSDCARRAFYKVLFDDLNLSSRHPKLAEFVETYPIDDILQYQKSVEGFARAATDVSIPVNRGDMTVIYGALLNVESIFARFDSNNDGHLDNDELDRAYPLFKDVILNNATPGGLPKALHFLGKSIFIYMVKYKKLPDADKPTEILKFHFSPWKKKVRAPRTNLGILLFEMKKALTKPKDPSDPGDGVFVCPL